MRNQPSRPSSYDRYHRILDLKSFGKLVADGTIPSEGFTTLSSEPNEVFLRHTEGEAEVVDLFSEYKESKVGNNERTALYVGRGLSRL